MIDFSTFANNVDVTRFEESMQSTPINGRRKLYVAQKGIPNKIVSEIPGYTNTGKNIEGSVYNVVDSAVSSQAFLGEWKSASSQVLVEFDLTNGV